MTIQARYSGVCPECGERWQPGDLIRSDDRDPDCLPIWTHAACPTCWLTCGTRGTPMACTTPTSTVSTARPGTPTGQKPSPETPQTPL